MKAFVASLWVGLGGFLGANARYWLGGWAARRWGTGFPWGTFLINVTGSFALGLVLGWGSRHGALPQPVRLLVPVGFIGAYTTYSTFEYETFVLAESGSFRRAAANVVGSVAAGFVAVWLGVMLARLV